MISLVNSLSLQLINVNKAIGDTSIFHSFSIKQQEVDKAIGDTSVLHSFSIREKEMNPKGSDGIIESLSVSPNNYAIFGQEQTEKRDYKMKIIRNK